jgi:hypothetical protein
MVHERVANLVTVEMWFHIRAYYTSRNTQQATLPPRPSACIGSSYMQDGMGFYFTGQPHSTRLQLATFKQAISEAAPRTPFTGSSTQTI